jgi:transcriptional regulator with XRE-family HTH domain
MGTAAPDLPADLHIESRLAARLATLRREHGWSLDELAARSGISRASLSRLERGETSPTAAMLGRLCTAYGRTMSRLLHEIEANTSPPPPSRSGPTRKPASSGAASRPPPPASAPR